MKKLIHIPLFTILIALIFFLFFQIFAYSKVLKELDEGIDDSKVIDIKLKKTNPIPEDIEISFL